MKRRIYTTTERTDVRNLRKGNKVIEDDEVRTVKEIRFGSGRDGGIVIVTYEDSDFENEYDAGEKVDVLV